MARKDRAVLGRIATEQTAQSAWMPARASLDRLRPIERNGAGGGSRTPDLSLTKRLLYQLSYTGEGREVYETRGQPATHALYQGAGL